MLPSDARYPAVDLAAGHYESFYLKVADPASRRAVWLRYTVHKRAGEQPVGSLWATLFDEGGPYAGKVTPPPGTLAAGGGDYVRIGESRIGPGGAHGEIPGLASWELTFAGEEPPFLYLPRPWMYTAKLPRTKALSLRPALRASGTVTVRGRTVELDAWPGMVGHNWGAEHAERWIWMHGAAFAEDPDSWLDATIGRIRIGRWTTPWVANGCLSLGGVRHRLGGLGRTRATRVEESADRCTFELPGDGIVVHGDVAALREDVVGWIYSDPVGPQHHTAHCAISDMTLRVERRDREPLTLTVRGGATYELGMREHDHGIPIQPFPDP
ncbi:MAG: hypothetical protein WBC33_00880 [Conexibacter sp.]